MRGRLWRPASIAAVVLAGALGSATSALASDGVLEINQACAVNTGCFAGDTPGLPVTISTPGSYRLTSSLEADATAILIAGGVRVVTIDLNGFRIVGSEVLNSVGILGGVSASAITIRNGTIQDMGSDAVRIGGSAVIESVNALGNLGDGIQVNQTSIVRNGRIVGNGGYGILFSSNDSLYSGNVIVGNGLGSVQNGRPVGGNVCDDGLCTPSGRRRFYLTNGTMNGSQPDAPGVCDPGFHFASLWEILDPSALEYASDLGYSRDDAGAGPPSGPLDAVGWVRTGYLASTESIPGTGNCNNWASSFPGERGTTAWLLDEWDSGVSQGLPIGPATGPWVSQSTPCSVNLVKAWCVQD